MVFFTSSFPGLKNLSFREPNPLKGILSFLFSKIFMLTSAHFCCHISRCQTLGASASPLGDFCNNNQLLKKGAWKGKKNKNQNRSSKARKSVGKSSGVKRPWTHSGTQQCTCSSSAVHLCRVRYLYVGSSSGGCSWRAGGSAEGWCPWAGCSCLLHGQTSGWLAGAHTPCIPPSLPSPSLSCRDPVQGGAIVTDTIPVLKPLQFVNKITSMARARSLLNIHESFLQEGNYHKLQFPFTMYAPTPTHLLNPRPLPQTGDC